MASKRIRLLALFLSLLLWGFASSESLAADGVRAYRFDPHAEQIRFHWQRRDGTPYGAIAALLAEVGSNGKVRMAMNGGIYDTSLRPSGLYIESGKRLTPLNLADGKGNFFLKPNGVFFLQRGRPKIINSTRFKDQPDISDAIQSGPLMLERGRIHPAFDNNSLSRNVRNAVGITKKGEAVFLLASVPVSFYDFAVEARDRHGIADLLYLDGAISQMYVAPDVVPLPGRPFVTMITVEKKSEGKRGR